jgi:hypothetical protein
MLDGGQVWGRTALIAARGIDHYVMVEAAIYDISGTGDERQVGETIPLWRWNYFNY